MDSAQFRWNDCVRLFAVAAAVMVTLAVGAQAHANGPMGHQFGLGLAAGNPSTFTGKYYLGADTAVDFHLGTYRAYNRSRYGETLFLAGDYLYEVHTFVENGDISLPFYIGPGAALLFDLDDDGYCRFGRRCRDYDYDYDYDFGFGPRMPLGVALQFQKAPFEVFTTLSPTMLFLIDDDSYNDRFHIDFDIINLALGGRFYF